MKEINYKLNTKKLNEIFNISGYEVIEETFIVDTDSGCNGENNGFYGKMHSEETKKIISNKIKNLYKTDNDFKNSRRNFGEKNGMYGSARFGELSPMYGKKHSEETKKKMSEIKKKYYQTNPSPNKGKKLSDEMKKNLSEKNSKEYTLLSPNNDIIKIKNLTKFAKDNELSIGCLVQVVSGRNKSHRGWRKYE